MSAGTEIALYLIRNVGALIFGGCFARRVAHLARQFL